MDHQLSTQQIPPSSPTPQALYANYNWESFHQNLLELGWKSDWITQVVDKYLNGKSERDVSKEMKDSLMGCKWNDKEGWNATRKREVGVIPWIYCKDTLISIYQAPLSCKETVEKLRERTSADNAQRNVQGFILK